MILERRSVTAVKYKKNNTTVLLIESYAYLIGQIKTKLLGKHLWT